jgi:hypothetical protein
MEYTYDQYTFRTTRLRTTMSTSDTTIKSRRRKILQDLHYAYDCVGNVTSVKNGSQDLQFFKNQRVDPSNSYTYDAIYRLIKAEGREHLGQSARRRHVGRNHGTTVYNIHDQLPMATYEETFSYDPVGNMLSLRHASNNKACSRWTRRYLYEEPSQLEPSRFGNRLSATKVGDVEERVRYDRAGGETGNMTSMPALPTLRWNYTDELMSVSRETMADGTPNSTHYQYDDGGTRSRKTGFRQAAGKAIPTKKSENLYLGIVKFTANSPETESRSPRRGIACTSHQALGASR